MFNSNIINLNTKLFKEIKEKINIYDLTTTTTQMVKKSNNDNFDTSSKNSNNLIILDNKPSISTINNSNTLISIQDSYNLS